MTRLDDLQPEEREEVPQAGPAMSGTSPQARRLWTMVSRSERLRTLQWASVIGLLGVVAAAIFNIAGFVTTGAWQMLVVLGAMVVGAVGLVAANRLALRGRLEAASNLLLAAMVFAFACGELVHSGLTIYLGAGGVALILLAGLVFVPSWWWRWVIVAAGYVGYVALINWLQPLPRYDVQELGVGTNVFVFALLGFLLLASLFSITRVYQRLLLIRVRLPVSFALVVLGSVVVIAAAGAIVGSQGTRQQALKQLESVVSMKEAEIEQWIGRVDAALEDALTQGAVAPRMVLILQTPDLSETEWTYPDSYLQYVVQQSEYFQDFALLDRDGQVRMFTAVNADRPRAVYEADLIKGLAGFHIQSLLDPTSSDRTAMVALRPVVDTSGSLGVLAAMVDPASLNLLLGERSWLGDTGEMYLIDHNRRLLTDLRFNPARQIEMNTELESLGASTHSDVSMVYTDYRGEQVVGVSRWLPRLNVTLIVKQDLAESAAVTRDFMRVIVLVAVGASVIAVAVSALMARSITLPLAELTETADRIAGGDLSLAPALGQRDEIGTLSRAVTSMTTQLREMIGTLEGRVAERTQELERRSAYLEASADVGRAASSILDPEKLMSEVVELIRERFGLYYVGLFVLDETRQWAVLRAGTGRAGELMLKRGHRIEVEAPSTSRPGIVGWSVAHAQSRVAEEAAEDDGPSTAWGGPSTAWGGRLATPELPDTRSEAALPLRSRGQVLGAITVQDTRPGAFDAAALAVLQTMADQVAVAVDNARLFEQGQRALEAQQEAYGVISREAWQRLVETTALKGYRCDHKGVVPSGGLPPLLSRQAAAERRAITIYPASSPDGDGHGAERQAGGSGGPPEGTAPERDWGTDTPEMVGTGDRVELAVPVMVRDQVLGVLHFRKEESDRTPWSREQLTLVDGLAEQLGQALESARLYQDSQLRAGRERLAAGVTARMRESLDVETVLQTAARELQAVFSLAEVELRIHGGSTSPADSTREGSGFPGQQASDMEKEA